ncbi:MAG TPA: hypothetical protein VJ935_04070 [Acidimicrobiia bacterium]|nr:hypothetical protein [Acidimicrobiia bacterium]
MRFSGTLQTQGDPDGWLKTSLNLVGGRVEIVAGEETLGSWSVAQVKAERIEGNRFDLSLGDDRAVFVADDALAFSYEALPKLTKNPIVEVAQGFRQKLKASSRKAAKAAESAEPVPSEPHPAPTPSLADNIVWQDAPPEAPANVKRLRELIEAARANRKETGKELEDSVDEPHHKPEVTVLAIDPPMRLINGPDDSDPEPLWAGSEFGQAPKPPVVEEAEFSTALEETSDFFTSPVETADSLSGGEPSFLMGAEGSGHEDLVNELEQLMKWVSSGNLNDDQVRAASGLVRSIRALLES